MDRECYTGCREPATTSEQSVTDFARRLGTQTPVRPNWASQKAPIGHTHLGGMSTVSKFGNWHFTDRWFYRPSMGTSPTKPAIDVWSDRGLAPGRFRDHPAFNSGPIPAREAQNNRQYRVRRFAYSWARVCFTKGGATLNKTTRGGAQYRWQQDHPW